MRRLHPADHDLARRLLAGDDEACRELFDHHVPRLYRTVVRRLEGDRDLAEEVVQAVLVRALDRLSSYRGEASLLTWLTTLGFREIATRRRRPEVQRQHLSLEEQPGVESLLAALESSALPDEEMLRREVRGLVRATLDHLPRHYAEVLECKYLEDLSMQEIARRMGTGTTAIQSLLSRARRAFREGFEPALAAVEPR
jgi:RNA polymerase sigma-70 factor (ECF subfamily)